MSGSNESNYSNMTWGDNIKRGGNIMEEKAFEQTQMDVIIRNSRIPKHQIEPEVRLFLQALWECGRIMGTKKLLSTEFPMRKENGGQSCNADFVDIDENILELNELKTSSIQLSGRNKTQLNRYLKFKLKLEEKIQNRELYDFLLNEIDAIYKKSNSRKYRILMLLLEQNKLALQEIEQVRLRYIVPTSMKETVERAMQNYSNCDVITLPEIRATSNDDKIVIFLRALDYAGNTVNDEINAEELWRLAKTEPLQGLEPGMARKIYNQVKAYLTLEPVSIMISKSSKRPKYQVEYEDKTYKLFNHNGSPYNPDNKISSFDPSRMRDPIDWKEFESYIGY